MVTFTSSELSQEDPEMVAEFGEAMSVSLEAAEEDQEGSRELFVNY